MEQTPQQQALEWLSNRARLQEPLSEDSLPMSNKKEVVLVDLQPKPLRSAIEQVLAKG